MTVGELKEKLNAFDDGLELSVEVGDDAVPMELREIHLDDDSIEVILEIHPLGE